MNKTVFIGLSGGVDSSVAASRLINQGYKVVGVFIKVWHPDFMVCNWEQERLDAMRVAAHLDIPFLTCDAENDYKQFVADYFIEEYRSGRTPNPDVMCNQAVKFGTFMRFADVHGADYVATGHYAQKINGQLHRGVDTNKDQTYFLWTLTQEQLDKSLFPIGDTTKDEIRREAEQLNLPTYAKKDSQGICFLGHVDIPDFLSHYIDLIPGDVLNESGNIIGKHKGALVYTIGQRHGFTVESSDTNRQPMFVVNKNIENNTITVSDKVRKTDSGSKLKLQNVILRQAVASGEEIELQYRYRQAPITAEVAQIDNNNDLYINLPPERDIPATGQSCVLYQGSLCLGGGIIA